MTSSTSVYDAVVRMDFVRDLTQILYAIDRWRVCDVVLSIRRKQADLRFYHWCWYPPACDITGVKTCREC